METGVMRVCADPALLDLGPGARVGLFTNFTGTMPDLTRNVEALRAAGIPLVALYGPEHGLWGSAPAGESEPSGDDEATGLPVLDTYRKKDDDLDALLAAQRLTHLLVDFQEVGVRFYTYLWTLYDVMAAASRLGLPIVVLDRPNPLAAYGPAGPGMAPGISSFVGRVGIPLITGSTIGELARHFDAQYLGGDVDLTVVDVVGWDRTAKPAWEGPWVAPSPNMPSIATAIAYPGTCFFEGTHASEGRGTTAPFLQVGAPWMDGELTDVLRRAELPGVTFREVQFVPTSSKHQGARCRGTALHLTDPTVYEPLRTGITMLQTVARLYPDDFTTLAPYTPGGSPFLDLLWGSPVLRENLTTMTFDELLAASPTPSDVSREWRYA